MKHLILSVIFLCWAAHVFAQADSIEVFRQNGFLHHQQGNYQQAIASYSKIHSIHPADYDARLALGRLYLKTADYDKAIHFFSLIYQNDSTDVEALNGLGECYINKGKLSPAIEKLEKAVRLLPAHVPEYLLLAKAYGYAGNTTAALATYKKALAIDSTYAEVWAGIGRMHYWQSEPVSALHYYNKATTLAPQNTEIQQQKKQVRNELAYRFSGKWQWIKEEEETYTIEALVQRYAISKRTGNHFSFSGNFLLDHSNRRFSSQQNDTSRWFDNTWLKINWQNAHHYISAYTGASSTDNRITTYGSSWRYRNAWKHFSLENTLTGGYSYFYYWNEVGKMQWKNSLTLRYKRWSAEASYAQGEIDEAPARKYRSDEYQNRTNPFLSYRVALGVELLAQPKVQVQVVHSVLDYEYMSPDYYTPYNRNLTGLSASLYHKAGMFYIYGMYAYHIGTENFYYLNTNQTYTEGTIDVDNWSANIETGVQKGAFSAALGASRFYNPFYQNLTFFITARYNFVQNK